MLNNFYCIYEEALSKEFCDAALKELNWDTSVSGEIEPSRPQINANIRRTDVIWQEPMQPLGCIARCYMDFANGQGGWEYITTGQEATQLARYKASDNGYYDWHGDMDAPKNGVQRKLTCVILLNDASEFEGGMLELKGVDTPVSLTKRGSIIVFPSFILHRVTPVTAGNRYTATTWASGPSLK